MSRFGGTYWPSNHKRAPESKQNFLSRFSKPLVPWIWGAWFPLQSLAWDQLVLVRHEEDHQLGTGTTALWKRLHSKRRIPPTLAKIKRSIVISLWLGKPPLPQNCNLNFTNFSTARRQNRPIKHASINRMNIFQSTAVGPVLRLLRWWWNQLRYRPGALWYRLQGRW